MDSLCQRVEEASLNAVVALEQSFYDGWVIRFARGFTKRRNSVNPLYPSSMHIEDKVAQVEAQFAARGLAPTFRLTASQAVGELDAFLAARKYGILSDRVAVMAGELSPLNTGGARNITVARQTLSEWLPIHDAIGNIPANHQALHLDLLSRIPGQCYFATTFDSIRAAACVLAVREGDLVGIYEMVTAPDLRRRGHGAAVVQKALAWAHADGAKRAYLQVVESNGAAMALYGKLGFKTLYNYWYRAASGRTAGSR